MSRRPKFSSGQSSDKQAVTKPRAASNSQGCTPLPRGLQEPVAVKCERRDAGHPAAAGSPVRPGRPADDADDDGATWLVLEDRRAGIAGAGAEPVTCPLPDRIDQPDLQCAG